MQNEVIEGFQLSQRQRRLWLEGRGENTYVAQAAIGLEGPIDEERLKAAVSRLTARHDVLRAGFQNHPGMRVPVQVIHADTRPYWRRKELPSAGLGELEVAEEKRYLAELLHEERSNPFDLEGGPFVRATWARSSLKRSVLLLTVPALVADAYSLTRMTGELAEAYSRVGQGPSSEAEESIQFLQFAEWQHEMLDDEESAEGRLFWDERGTHSGTAASLPFEQVPVEDDAFVPGSLYRRLASDPVGLLHERARTSGIPAATWVLAAWGVLLWRLGGRREVVMGWVADGRPYEELREVCGPLSPTLPLRFELHGRQSFATAVEEAHESRLAAEEWQHCFAPSENLSSAALFPVVFGSETWPEAVDKGNVRWTLLLRHLCCERFRMRLSVIEQGTAILFEIAYDSQRYRLEDVERLSGFFEELILGAVRRPATPIEEIDLLDASHRQMILSDLDNTVESRPGTGSVYELFARHATQTPHRTALVFEDRRFTFAGLDLEAGRLAGRLGNLGISRESVVAILVERSAEMILMILGILRAGAAYTALDLNQPRERLAHMLRTSGAAVVLTRQRLRDHLPSCEAEVLCIEQHVATGSDGRVQDGDAEVVSAYPENLAYVIFTSGSTGQPKGVGVEHRQLIHYVGAIGDRLKLGDDARLAVVSSFATDLGHTSTFTALCGGRCLHVLSEERVLDSEGMAQYLESRPIDVLKIVPSHLDALLSSDDPGRSLPRQWLVLGGEVSRPDWVEALRKVGACEMLNHYGPAESTVGVMTWKVTGELRDTTLTSLPLGRPLANVRIYLLEPRLVPAPPWVPAELCIAGTGLARGYLRQPALTAERFVPDAFSGEPDERMYRTGDLARLLSDGTVEFLGRHDAQVKIRGFRVEIGEVEAHFLQHPLVRQAIVVAQERSGRALRLLGFVVPRRPAATVKDELRRFLQDRLPDYMVPGVVVLSELPLLPNGKVDRRALAEYEQIEERPPFVQPFTHVEKTIAAVWQEVLELDQVGSHDNFFELGGHSLLVVRVHALLRETGFDLSVTDLFQYPTVTALAEFLEDGRPTAAEAAARARTPSPGSSNHVAVIGMAGRFPGARDIERFWRNLRDGVESITFFADEELLAAGTAPQLLSNPRFVGAQGVLEKSDQFDAAFFGYSPREAELMDPQHRVFLECTWHALEDAGYDPSNTPGRVGLFAGAGMSLYLINVFSNPEVVRNVDSMQIRVGNRPDFLPTRVSYKMNLRGPSVNVQTACSTSLVAVHLACQSLLRGEAEMAIAGGVRVDNRRSGYLYEEGGIDSPDGHCRAFDAEAGGTVNGEGVGAVVLKRLEDALAENDSIRAVIRGSAINNDGSVKVGFTAPGIDGQTAVVREALSAADVEPETIGYVEAHGTATPLGDPIEIQALTQAFGPHTALESCALGSVKTNIGHLDAAAGIAGVIKTVLAIQHAALPPNLHYRSPNPQIDFAETPFYVNAEFADWPDNGGPRRAGVSSLGMGGTNAHVVFEEAPPAGAPGPSRPSQLLMLSARTPSALEEMTKNLGSHLETHPEQDFADAAYTLQTGRSAFRHRRFLVCHGRDDAVGALKERNPERIFSRAHEGRKTSIAFLFPGQGSQHLEMGRQIYQTEPTFKRWMDHCMEELSSQGELDLRPLLTAPQRDPDRSSRRLNETDVTQPALFIVEYALAQLFMDWGIRPYAMLGHSIGEYVAACLAGVFSLKDALSLVAARGRLMQSLSAGCMVSIPLPENEVGGFLDGALSQAAVNSEGSCVVSGPPDSVAALEQRLKAKDIDFRRLHVSHAFHSDMMDPILEDFAAEVGNIALREPKIPYLSNLTGTWATGEQATDPGYWVDHLRRTVRFHDGLTELLSRSEPILLEVGPGQVLTNLARQHPERDRAEGIVSAMRRPRDLQPDSAFLMHSVGKLWLLGVQVDWSRFYAHERRRRVPLPVYPFEGRRYWLEDRSAEFPVAAVTDLSSEARMDADTQTESDGSEERSMYSLHEYVEPRSETERDLVKMWRDIVGVKKIGVHDDFFELGGSSFMAVSLRSRLRQTFAIEMYTDFLLEMPTIAALASYVEEHRNSKTDVQEERSNRHPCLVPLQPAGDSIEHPLFLVHPVGGHAYYYRSLVKELAMDRPVYGLRARGFEDGEELNETIEDMASDYIQAVLSVDAAGPYFLGGGSMGAMIAYEMARQLDAKGREVVLLVMMDAPDPNRIPNKPKDDTDLLIRIYDRYPSIPLEELRSMELDDQVRFLLEEGKSEGLIPNDFVAEDANRHIKVVGGLFQALHSYQPGSYSGRITFFRARERRPEDVAHPELPWVELAEAGAEIQIVPGNHYSMFHSPNLQVLAGALGTVLDRVRTYVKPKVL